MSDQQSTNDYRSIEIAAADGVSLAGRLYEAVANPIGVVMLVPAMGVRQSFYEGFARWLVSEGYDVVSFDYRGIGASSRGSLRREAATITTWATLDTQAVVEYANRRADGRPTYWIGHILGGQIVPFVEGHKDVAKVITVATGSGYWKENVPRLKWIVWWMWFVVVPVSLFLCGYFPGKKLKKVGNLPKGVMAQWRQWCLNPDYSVGVEDGARSKFASVQTPVCCFSFTDDEMLSEANFRSIQGFFDASILQERRMTPADVRARRVGHFGFFRESLRDSLWRAHLLPELS